MRWLSDGVLRLTLRLFRVERLPPLEDDPRWREVETNLSNMRGWAELGERLWAELGAKRAGDVRNGLEGALVRIYEGGRPRRWSGDPRWQEKMEAEARRLIAEGKSDREVADGVFGDRKLYKRIQRFRRSDGVGS
jgi:hypothetical protein